MIFARPRQPILQERIGLADGTVCGCSPNCKDAQAGIEITKRARRGQGEIGCVPRSAPPESCHTRPDDLCAQMPGITHVYLLLERVLISVRSGGRISTTIPVQTYTVHIIQIRPQALDNAVSKLAIESQRQKGVSVCEVHADRSSGFFDSVLFLARSWLVWRTWPWRTEYRAKLNTRPASLRLQG